MNKVKIYAPASIGNVGVGFDILGAAISPIEGTLLGDCVTAEKAEQFSLDCAGSFVKKLPSNMKENIVYQCWKRYCQEIGEEVAVHLTLEKNMPIGSGLGSSACSVVASLMALNEYCNNPLNKQQLLTLMGEMEGRISGSIHYDNVAPCYFGGLQFILEQKDTICQSIPCFDNWLWVMAYPGIKVSTAEARAILPKQYDRKTCIEHSRNLAGFIHACYSQQPELAATLMQDVIAEPYRKSLLPGFTEARQAAQQIGALAQGISGSGPTLFAICDQIDKAQQLATWLQQHYVQNSEGFVHICQLDLQGARILG